MERVLKWFTVGRAIALALIALAGGVGAGVGFLLGEGEARATFSALHQDHERRIVAIEVHGPRILEGLAELKGELRALRREVRP